MTDLVLHPNTAISLEDYLSKPGQAIGLYGQSGLNKYKITTSLSEQLLNLGSGSLGNYPYFLEVKDDNQKIGIEPIRTLNDFLILKVPLKNQINRVVIIPEAERLTIEAQNALLKNLEEPPQATVIILSFSNLNDLLPTIISRLHLVKVNKPRKEDLLEFYLDQGYDQAAIAQAYLMADGLPGLIEQLLTSPDNSFSKSAQKARQLLSSTTFERLSKINELAKNKQELKELFFVIKQMAKIGLTSANPKNAKRWQQILEATLASENQLQHNVQVKLVLANYMLAIS